MKKRIIAIDVLRGFALLGILLMNITSFSMPDSAYFNPTAYYHDTLIDRLLYALTHLIADQKFMALFSMLFGASVMLITSKFDKKGESPAKTHYIRNIWLLLFGLVHATFIWSGDILMVYALCSFVLYFFRKVSPKWQFTLGLIIFLIPSLLNIGIQLVVPTLDSKSQTALAAYWQPTTAVINDSLDFYRGSYSDQLRDNLSTEAISRAYPLGEALVDLSTLTDFFSRAFGMMLIGMAFYNWGILTAQKSTEFYQRLLKIGLGLGFLIALLGLIANYAFAWEWQYALFLGRIPNNIATPLIASGYIAAIMLWSRSDWATKFRDRLAAVGRMALTNYIGQSIMGTFIFYGFGLGLFGSVNRAGQLFCVLLIWGIQLWLSPWWLSRFRYGPLEWLWRSLTKLRPQPIRKQPITA